MSTFDDGGPAFPQAMNGDKQPVAIDFPSMGGMSLRDYFAAQVVPSVVSCAFAENWAKGGPEWREAIAEEAYTIADAMLAARAKAQA